MRIRLALMAVMVGLILAADEPPADALKKEWGQLSGTWRLVSSESDGKRAPLDPLKTTRVVITMGKHSVYFGDQAVAKEIPFAIDPSKNPKTSQDTLPDGRTVLGIYKLEGDQLTSCVAPIGKPRPTEFSTRPGSGHTLRVFQREKP